MKKCKFEVSWVVFIINEFEFLLELYEGFNIVEIDVLVFSFFNNLDKKGVEKFVFIVVFVLVLSNKLKLVFFKFEKEDWGSFFDDYFYKLLNSMMFFEMYSMFVLVFEFFVDKEMINEVGDRFWLCLRLLEVLFCKIKIIFNKKKLF